MVINMDVNYSNNWDDIESIDPDEWDLKMMQDIENDPDCRDFISSNEAMKELGLL